MPENRIHILSDHVANKIAAGEVVDRPASVVKELLENAVDAGATQVDVQVFVGGRKSIIISDNGCGMSRDDALLSIERHATSKIRDVDDIEQVHTMGFRGEALAAIASVSRFTLVTRPADDVSGTEITIAGGALQDVTDAGCPVGTTFKIRNLFYNVPARRKFLRTEQTELGHIKQTFQVHALAHPRVGMKLMADERELYHLPPASTLGDRLHDLYSRELIADLCAIDFEGAGVRVYGWVGQPHVHRSNRNEQYVFINHRPASAPLVGHAIRESYRDLVPAGRHPVIFLNIELDPGMVDVNVHPAKKEVRFRNGNVVRDTVLYAIRDALSLDPPPQREVPVTAGLASASAVPAGTDPAPAPRTFDYASMIPETQPAIAGLEAARPAPRPAPVKGSPWKWCRVVDRVGELFIVLETEDGLVIMDPQAAHERVIYERFMQQLQSSQVNAQGLLQPETISLTPKNALIVSKNLPLLQRMGFSISSFGGESFLVDALPVCLGNISASEVLTEVAHTLEHAGSRGGTETWAREQVARSACATAVRAREKLSEAEIRQLVEDLAATAMPYTSPRGRPTLIYYGFNELKRKFGRE